MPILPENKKRYPSDWKSIRNRILDRSRKAVMIDGVFTTTPCCEWCRAINHQPHPVTGAKVVLTIAHLNHVPSDCRDENLAALCQKCHNNYDAPSRQMKKEVKRQVWEAMRVGCRWKAGDGCHLRPRPKKEEDPQKKWKKQKKGKLGCSFSKCPLVSHYRSDYRKIWDHRKEGAE